MGLFFFTGGLNRPAATELQLRCISRKNKQNDTHTCLVGAISDVLATDKDDDDSNPINMRPQGACTVEPS